MVVGLDLLAFGFLVMRLVVNGEVRMRKTVAVMMARITRVHMRKGCPNRRNSKPQCANGEL